MTFLGLTDNYFNNSAIGASCDIKVLAVLQGALELKGLYTPLMQNKMSVRGDAIKLLTSTMVSWTQKPPPLCTHSTITYKHTHYTHTPLTHTCTHTH